MEAAGVILWTDSIFFFKKIIRAFFGASKYCQYFLNKQKCANPEKCEFLHRLPLYFWYSRLKNFIFY